jgi:hypothetical protein
MRMGVYASFEVPNRRETYLGGSVPDTSTRGFAQLGDATALPPRFETTWPINDDVHFALVVTVLDGVPRATEIRLFTVRDGAEVTAQHLRERKLENLIEFACMTAGVLVEHHAGFVSYTLSGSPDDAQRLLTDVRSARKRARRRGYPDELLREVADIYQRAERHPTKAVREALGVAESTAQLYVKKARERFPELFSEGTTRS